MAKPTQQDFTFSLHEMMKPLANPTTTVVHDGRAVTRGRLWHEVQENDGDHLFHVGRVSFVEDDVELIDDENQKITLRPEWSRRAGGIAR